MDIYAKEQQNIAIFHTPIECKKHQKPDYINLYVASWPSLSELENVTVEQLWREQWRTLKPGCLPVNFVEKFNESFIVASQMKLALCLVKFF